MASPTTPEKFADMPFPMYGLDLMRGFGLQRFNTTATGVNVRGFEPMTGRGRGGSRPGLSAYTPVVPANPAQSLLIQHLNIIVDPQFPALPATIGDGNGSGQPPAILGPTAVLDPSTPDELGPRTSGDYWVPKGGWGAMSRRLAPITPGKTVAYCIAAALKIQGGIGLTFLGQTHQTCVCQANFFLNGVLFGSVTGTATATVPASGPIQYTDWASTAWYSVNSLVPVKPTQNDGGNTNILGQTQVISGGRSGTPQFSFGSISQSAFNTTANLFTATNTVSVTGQITVTGDGTDCTGNAGVGTGIWPLSGAGPQFGALIEAKALITTDSGASWTHGPSASFTSFGGGTNLAPVPGGSQIYTNAFNFNFGTPTFKC